MVPDANERRAAAIAQVYAGVRRWAERIADTAALQESGWHRLHVQIDRGKVATIQIVTDEKLDLHATSASSAPLLPQRADTQASRQPRKATRQNNS